jgi:hypothetical protein
LAFEEQNGPRKNGLGRKKSGTKVPHSRTQLSTRVSIAEIIDLSRAIFIFFFAFHRINDLAGVGEVLCSDEIPATKPTGSAKSRSLTPENRGDSG